MKNLIALYLANNSIGTISPFAFNFSESLITLDLSGNNLSDLPSEIFMFLWNCEHINIRDNDISILPLLGNSALLKVLDLGHNNLIDITNFVDSGLHRLRYLSLIDNKIHQLMPEVFDKMHKLRLLDLSFNSITILPAGLFEHLFQLVYLRIVGNQLVLIEAHVFRNVTNLHFLEIQNNNLSSFDLELNQAGASLRLLNLSNNQLSGKFCQKFCHLNVIEVVDFRHNPLQLASSKSLLPFKSAKLLVDHFATCCFVDDKSHCVSENTKSAYLTCHRMFSSVFLRICLWSLGILAVISNCVSMYIRLGDKSTSKGQRRLIMHLSMADLLMGLDMLLLAAADSYYHGYFPSYSESWRKGIFCKLAGILSILSSEASVFTLTLISIDRCLHVKFPLENKNTFGRTTVICSVWFISCLISILPMSLSYLYPKLYDVSEVCVGIPMVKHTEISYSNQTLNLETLTYIVDVHTESERRIEIDPRLDTSIWRGTRFILNDDIDNMTTIESVRYVNAYVSGHTLASYLSIIIFIGVNSLCFMFILICYINIFLDARSSFGKFQKSEEQHKKEIRMAFRISLVILTDFLCWIPISFICLLVQLGVVSVSPEVYAWTVAFILPINSSINPFLYTLAEEISKFVTDMKKKKKKQEEEENAGKMQ